MQHLFGFDVKHDFDVAIGGIAGGDFVESEQLRVAVSVCGDIFSALRLRQRHGGGGRAGDAYGKYK